MRRNRIVGAILLVVMLLSSLPITAHAEEMNSGTCGNNVTWTLDSDGTLTISGTGEMANYTYGNYAPWESSIKTVVIENGVTSIGDWAFYKCSGLTSVTISSSVISIGDSAFYSCEGLTSITIPSSVTSIGDSAFYSCEGLTSITIPSSVTSIGEGIFSKCSNLTNITLPDSITSIDKRAFSDTAYYNDTKNWTDGVLYIGNHLIETKSDEITSEYKIKEGTKTIAAYAFYFCSGLTSVTIPSSVTSIVKSAFDACNSLTSINVDELNQNYSSLDGNLFNKNKTQLIQYAKGKKETSYIIPSSVTNIGGYAFDGCSSLTSITIPSSVTSIDDWAFWQCYGLTNVTIPSSVISIGYSAFSRCSGLISITIPSSVTSISNYAFSYCYSLIDVYYSGTEEEWNQIEIGYGNHSLEEATIHFNSVGTAKPVISEINIVPAGGSEGKAAEIQLDTVQYDSVLITLFCDRQTVIDNKLITLSAGDTSKMVTIPANANAVKVFIWGSLVGMHPLCETKTKTIE